MRTLLLEKDRKALRKEYRLRLCAVGFWVVAGTMFLGAVMLMPAYFLADAREDAARAEIARLGIAVPDAGQVPASELGALKGKMKLLEAQNDQTLRMDLLREVLSSKPRSVVITGMHLLSRPDEGTEELTLTGVSATRENLLVFKETLERNPHFTNVTLPVSDLASRTDVEFSITLEQVVSEP